MPAVTWLDNGNLLFERLKIHQQGQPGFVHVVKYTAQLIVRWRDLASKVIYL
jgi:hypothetical protein